MSMKKSMDKVFRLKALVIFASLAFTQAAELPPHVGAVTEVEQFDVYGKRVAYRDGAGQTANYQYDAGGRLIKETVNSRTTVYYRDGRGRVISTEGAKGQIQLTYTAQDEIETVRDGKGVITRYSYDGFDQLTQLSSPDAGTSTYVRDKVGRVIQRTDARGVVTKYQYDNAGRLMGLDYGQGETVSYGYDNAGRLVRELTPSAELAYTYDAYSRLSSQTLAIAGKSFKQTFTYSNGVLNQYVYPSGLKLNFEWKNGQLAEVKVNGKVLVGSLAYQVNAQPKAWRWGNGQVWQAASDGGGRITGVTLGNNNELVTYDANGNIGALDLGAGSQTYQYDGSDRIVKANVGSTQYDYMYDGNGNRTNLFVSGRRMDYAIDGGSNRLTRAVGMGVDANYQYDAAGNRTSDGRIADTYNRANRLASVVVEGKTWNYRYTSNGERVQKINPDGTLSTFVYGTNGELIGEYDSTGKAKEEIVWLSGRPIASIRNGKIYYVMTDHLATPRQLIDSTTKQVVWNWAQDEPFGANVATGEVVGNEGKINFNLRFPGQYYDAETSRNYNYYRDYDSAMGRYTQTDPLGLSGGINLYSYVDSNPLIYEDPDGLKRRTVNLGKGWTGHVDEYDRNGGPSVEVHVIDPKGKEVGMYGPDGWFNKHGLEDKRPDGIPDFVENQCRGAIVDFARRAKYMPPKGEENIKGKTPGQFARKVSLGKGMGALGIGLSNSHLEACAADVNNELGEVCQ